MESPRKQKSKGVELTLPPGTTRLTLRMAVPDVKTLPWPSQHCVLRLENGIVVVVGVADAAVGAKLRPRRCTSLHCDWSWSSPPLKRKQALKQLL